MNIGKKIMAYFLVVFLPFTTMLDLITFHPMTKKYLFGQGLLDNFRAIQMDLTTIVILIGLTFLTVTGTTRKTKCIYFLIGSSVLIVLSATVRDFLDTVVARRIVFGTSVSFILILYTICSVLKKEKELTDYLKWIFVSVACIRALLKMVEIGIPAAVNYLLYIIFAVIVSVFVYKVLKNTDVEPTRLLDENLNTNIDVN